MYVHKSNVLFILFYDVNTFIIQSLDVIILMIQCILLFPILMNSLIQIVEFFSKHYAQIWAIPVAKSYKIQTGFFPSVKGSYFISTI